MERNLDIFSNLRRKGLRDQWGVKVDANSGADAARRTFGLVLFCAGHKEEVVNLQYNGIGLNNSATDGAGRTYYQVYRHLGV